VEEGADAAFDARFVLEAAQGDGVFEFLEAFLEALDEEVIDGLFLVGAVLAPTKHEGFLAIGGWDGFDLDAVLDLDPVLVQEMVLEAAEGLPGSADQIVAASLADEFEIFLGDHAAVHDPDTVGAAVFVFDGMDHVLDGGDVGAIAVEDLVCKGEAFLGDDEGEADLLAV
jgi:hypothetical protein